MNRWVEIIKGRSYTVTPRAGGAFTMYIVTDENQNKIGATYNKKFIRFLIMEKVKTS